MAVYRTTASDFPIVDTIYDSDKRKPAVIEEIVELLRFRSLVVQLVLRNLKSRYKRSFLGVVWTMLNPLLMMTVLTLVFSQLFHFAIKNYPVYILAGLAIWNFYSQSTTSAMYELVWSGSYLKRIYLPRTIFIISNVGTGLVNLILTMIPLGIIMAGLGHPFSSALLFLPIPILFGALFTIGLGLLLSALSIFFTDVVEFYQVLLIAWMYLTPIIYPQEVLPLWLSDLMWLNPFVPILECFRDPIYRGILPEFSTILIAALTALVSLAIGWSVFCWKADQIAYHV